MSRRPRQRQSKSYEPEEKLGCIFAPKRKDQKSLLLVIDDLQLSRGEKGDLEKWWRVPLKGFMGVLEFDPSTKKGQPYVNIYVSKISPNAPVEAQLEDEERVADFEEGPEEEGE